MRKPWTTSDTQTLERMASAGYSDGEIAEHMGRHRDVIGRARRHMGIRAGISPALVAMMARVNARRFRLTNHCRSFA